MRIEINFIGLLNRTPQEVNEIIKIAKKAVARNKEFFECDSFPITINLASTRRQLERRAKKKGPDWFVGNSNFKNKVVFILAPWAFEKESSHPKSNFPKVLIHEISHLYINKVYTFSEPRWLIEGLACYLAEQQQPLPSIKKKLLTPSFLFELGKGKNWSKNVKNGAYALSYYWIEFLVKKYGKKSFLKFLTSLTEENYNLKDSFKRKYDEDIEKIASVFINHLRDLRKGGEKDGDD